MMTVQGIGVIFLLVLGYCSAFDHNVNGPVDPEIYMNATGLITSKGFPCENHYVVTEDGFILNMQRIPRARYEETTGAPKPVVMLQHGLLGSSTNFLDNLVNESLAYILADAGADVWLGNVRGNNYSRAHKTLKPSDEKFWAWSWDEMAKYDLPAMIDYILQTTGQTEITYVGHSQGTMIGFSGFSENKTLGKKIKTFVALAPVAKVRHLKGPLRKLAPYAKAAEPFLELLGHGEFMPSSELTVELGAGFCEDVPFVCENIFFILGGSDAKGLNQSRVPVYIAHNPAGTSVQNLLHFAQGVNTDAFQKFDYGSAEANNRHYGQPTPPSYHPDELEVPVVLYHGGSDYMADPDDVAWLKSQVKNIKADHQIPEWEHFDFIWAVDAPALCYNEIVKLVFS